jgi:hypothetical protein
MKKETLKREQTSSVSIVSLSYEIMFDDADDGRCFAGNGLKIVRAFATEAAARQFAEKWNPIITLAESEEIVFPVQPNNAQLKEEMGFTLHDIDDGRKFSLVIQNLDVTLPAPRTDYWRDDFRSYASQWGYEPGSKEGELIDFVRDIYRAKYGSDYRLHQNENGKFSILPGTREDGSSSLYGEEFIRRHAKEFGVEVTEGLDEDPSHPGHGSEG